MKKTLQIATGLVAIALVSTACSSLENPPAADISPTAADQKPQDPCNRAEEFSDLSGKEPGEVLAKTKVEQGEDDPNFPAGSDAWRVLYVSTGQDNTDLQMVCGMVQAPSDPAKIQAASSKEGRGRMVSWTHGTIGLQARCQPSMHPEKQVWGAMPSGFNVVGWGKDGKPTGRLGTPEGGAVQHMINEGWVVSATDYYADLQGTSELEPYIVGKNEGTNAIDLARAAHRILTDEHSDLGLNGYDYLTWGHSQGGHSAIWAAQIAETYLRATKTSSDPELALRGAALLAPATTIIVDPKEQPYSDYPYGLADWALHQTSPPTLLGEGITLGPALFSFILGAWAQVSSGTPPKSGEMPSYPIQQGNNLSLGAIATENAVGTVANLSFLCLEAEPVKVAENIAKYTFEDFLIPELSNGQEIAGQLHGNVSKTCFNDPPKEIGAWCDWMRYQQPGPFGTSEFPKLPKYNGDLVPVYIADGTNDIIIRCKPTGKAEDVLPNEKDCLSHAFYTAMKQEAYCPKGDAKGYLALDLWQDDPNTTTAGHFDVPGLASAKDLDNPTFVGSPLQQFMDGAMNQMLPNQCVKPRLMNPSDNPTGAQK